MSQNTKVAGIMIWITVVASLLTAACGINTTKAPETGPNEETDLNLAGSSAFSGGPMLPPALKMPASRCEDAPIISTPVAQMVKPLASKGGLLEVYLGSSSWSKAFEEGLIKTGQSAAMGAGFRILSSKGGLSPVNAPWSGIDQLVVATPLRYTPSPLFNQIWGSGGLGLLGITISLQRVTSNGSGESMPLKFRPNYVTDFVTSQTRLALIANTGEKLSPGSYRLLVNPGKIQMEIQVRPGDVDDSYSVNEVDKSFIERNKDKPISVGATPAHTIALLKADLNGDGTVDQADLDLFNTTNPDVSKLLSNFYGDPFTANPGDIFAVGIRSMPWTFQFQNALGQDLLPVGHRIAPVSCPQILPWTNLNQLILAGLGNHVLSGTVSVSLINQSGENQIMSSDLAKLPRIAIRDPKTGQITSLTAVPFNPPAPRMGVYKVKISINKANATLDGVATRIIKFRLLEGDVSGNGIVDTIDFQSMSLGMPVSTNPRMDINGSGSINSSDIALIRMRMGQRLIDPTVAPQEISETNKVHISDDNGNFVAGVISATIDGQVVAKFEVNGQDARIGDVKGKLGAKVTWSNSVDSQTFETILDGKGDYDGRGHYVTFKVKTFIDVPDVPTTQPEQPKPEQPPVTELNKVHINDANGRFMPGVISAAIDGKLVGQAKLDGRDAGLVSVSGPYGSKVVWSNNLNSETFVTILDGRGDYGSGHYVVFKIVQNEKGGCGRYFGSTAGSFSSTQDECRMKQEEIDSTCKNYSGQDYKINWTRFNSDSTVKEVINLQSGTCLKLPQQPPTYVDNPTQPPSQPEPNPTHAAKVGVGFETGVDMDFNDVYACIPKGDFNVNGREIISANNQSVPVYFGNLSSQSNLIIVKASVSGQLIFERHVMLPSRQQTAGKTFLDLPKGATVTFQLMPGILHTDPKRAVVEINTCRSGA